MSTGEGERGAPPTPAPEGPTKIAQDKFAQANAVLGQLQKADHRPGRGGAKIAFPTSFIGNTLQICS